MQFESWEDAVKKAKAKAREDALDLGLVLDSAPSPVKPARWRLGWKGPAIAGGILGAFVLGFLVSRFYAGAPPVAPSVSGTIAPIPSDYRVLKIEGDNAKDVVSVRLSSKVDVPRLEEIARLVWEKRTTGKPRMVFWFYLPEIDTRPSGLPFGVQPWAFADFDTERHAPVLTTQIQGFTLAEEIKLVSGAVVPPGASVLGRWLDDSYGQTLYTIFRQGGALFLRHQGSLESAFDQELVGDGRSDGGRFRRKEFSETGERYVINGRGDFEIRDNDGCVTLAKHVVH